jgi:hypothetical protein
MGLRLGIGFGLLLCLIVFPTLSAMQALLAGVVRARSRTRIGTVLRYLEMALPAGLVFVFLMIRVLSLAGSWMVPPLPIWYGLIIILSFSFLFAAAIYRKPWWVRLAAQLCFWIISFILLR